MALENFAQEKVWLDKSKNTDAEPMDYEKQSEVIWFYSTLIEKYQDYIYLKGLYNYQSFIFIFIFCIYKR